MVTSFPKLQEGTRMWHWEVISMKRWEGMVVIIMGARESSLMLITSPSTSPQISVLSTGTLGRQSSGWEHIPSAFLEKALQCMEMQVGCRCVFWKGKYGQPLCQAVPSRKRNGLGSFLRVAVGPGIPQNCSSIHIIWMQRGFEDGYCEPIFHFRCRTRWRERYLRVMTSIKKVIISSWKSSFSSDQVPHSSSVQLTCGVLQAVMFSWERISSKCCVKPRTACSALAFWQQPFC